MQHQLIQLAPRQLDSYIVQLTSYCMNTFPFYQLNSYTIYQIQEASIALQSVVHCGNVMDECAVQGNMIGNISVTYHSLKCNFANSNLFLLIPYIPGNSHGKFPTFLELCYPRHVYRHASLFQFYSLLFNTYTFYYQIKSKTMEINFKGFREWFHMCNCIQKIVFSWQSV